MPPTTFSDATRDLIATPRAIAPAARPARARSKTHRMAASPLRVAETTTADDADPPRRDAAPAHPDPAVVAHRVGRLAVLSLPIGVLLSLLTSHDPTWWHHHFSQLCTHSDFSGRTFNTVAIFSGFFLSAYGVLVAVALPAGMSRRRARGFRGSIVSAGLHLTAVGLVPIPVSAVMHDLVAACLGLSFLATVATGLTIPGRSRRFRRITAFCVALLTVGIVVLTAGFITLALFELVAFVTRFCTLEPGDIITTGTPSGVGPLNVGDRVMVKVQGVGALSNPCVDA